MSAPVTSTYSTSPLMLHSADCGVPVWLTVRSCHHHTYYMSFFLRFYFTGKHFVIFKKQNYFNLDFTISVLSAVCIAQNWDLADSLLIVQGTMSTISNAHGHGSCPSKEKHKLDSKQISNSPCWTIQSYVISEHRLWVEHQSMLEKRL